MKKMCNNSLMVYYIIMKKSITYEQIIKNHMYNIFRIILILNFNSIYNLFKAQLNHFNSQ